MEYTLNEVSIGFPVTHNLSIDEAMVSYYGHHSAKQYMKGKPIKFGF
jgi:hypothetical protein